MFVVEVEYKLGGMQVAHTMDVQADTFEDAIEMAHNRIKETEPSATEVKILSAEQTQGA